MQLYMYKVSRDLNSASNCPCFNKAKKMALLKLLLCIMLNVMSVTTSAIECPQMCDCQVGICTDCNNTLVKPKLSFDILRVDCRARDMNESMLTQELDVILSDEQLRENLVWLNVTNTPLTEVPMSVCRLSKLQLLYLADNRLTRLPGNCFTNMTSLRWLSAQNNRITKLQDGLFDGLNSLEVDFSHNWILELQEGLFDNLKSLVAMDFSFNVITELHDGLFDGLHSLKFLNFSYNAINELQDGLFDGLNSLEVLDFSSNKIASIGLHVFSNPNDLVKLKLIQLSFNRLGSLEPWPYI